MTARPFQEKRPDSRLTPELIGLWETSGRRFEISKHAFFSVYQAPLPYAINEPELNWNGWIFKRLMGTPGSIVGVWQEPNTKEDVFFRDDNSLTWHDPNDDTQLFGTWVTTTGPDKLGTSEARAFLVEKGNRLTFYMLFGGENTYKFKVSQTELVLSDPSTGTETVFTRV